MKLNIVRLSLLSILVICGTVLSQAHIHAQAILSAIEPINSGETVEGSIPASTIANDCVLGSTQYRIEIVGGDKQLQVLLNGTPATDLYMRRNAPVAIEDGKIVSDFKSFFSGSIDGFSLPFFFGSAPLQAGSYFIAITNCATTAANYKLTATILGPPDVAILNLPADVVGSIPAPVPGNCGISPTQYRLIDEFNTCGFGPAWFITIHADQNVNVVIRRDKPVAVENGVITYDFMSENQVKIHHLSKFQQTPGAGTFFIAVLNCGFETINYTVSASQSVQLPALFFISNVSLKKKKLHVTGMGIRGTTVLIDGQPQETIDGGQDERFFDVLIVKDAKKKLPRNQTVIISATKPSGCTTNNFAFTRH